MPNKLCFFTDLDSLVSPGPTNAPGSIDQTNYRIGHSFSVATESRAFAICDATILLQYNDLGNLNIILKPLNRDDFPQPVDLIIYQNIKESSILSGTDIATRTNNDLTEYLWSNQEKTDTNEGVEPRTPKAEFTGVLTSLDTSEYYVADETEIFSLFYYDKQYQFPVVKAGDYIGNFIGGSVASGIILHRESQYNIVTAGFLRKTGVVYTCVLDSSSSDLERQYEKEKVLSYYDSIALLGDAIQTTRTVEFKKTNDDMATKEEFFESLTDCCFTYIDIRNENNLSYDFYKEFGSTLDIVKTSETLTDVNYYGDTLIWPILQFPANGLTDTVTISLHSTPDWIANYFVNCLSIEDSEIKSTFVSPVETLDIELKFGTFSGTSEDLFYPSYRKIVLKSSRLVSNESAIINRDSIELNQTFNIQNIVLPGRQNDVGFSFKLFQEQFSMLKEGVVENYGDTYIADLGIAVENDRIIFCSLPTKYTGYYRDFGLGSGNHLLKSIYSKSFDGLDEFIAQFYPETTFRYFNDSEINPDVTTSLISTIDSDDNAPLISEVNFDSISISNEDWDAITTTIDEDEDIIKGLPIYLSINSENFNLSETNDFFEFETEIQVVGFKSETVESVSSIVPYKINTGIKLIANSFNS